MTEEGIVGITRGEWERFEVLRDCFEKIEGMADDQIRIQGIAFVQLVFLGSRGWTATSDNVTGSALTLDNAIKDTWGKLLKRREKVSPIMEIELRRKAAIRDLRCELIALGLSSAHTQLLGRDLDTGQAQAITSEVRRLQREKNR